MFDPPLLIVVTGAPASGKTGVAERLAVGLRVPFIVKDTFKERLYEVFGSGEEVESQIEEAALAILFSVVEAQLQAGVSVVAESNFTGESDLGAFRRIDGSLHPRIVQVHCHRERDVLLERFARRSQEGERHPGHEDGPEKVAEVARRLDRGDWEPLDLPGELLRFQKDREDEEGLLARVRELAGAAAPA